MGCIMKKFIIIISIVILSVFLLGWFVTIPIEYEKTYDCIQWELGNANSLKNVTVTLKKVEYLSLFEKNKKTISVSINGNALSTETPIEDFSSDNKHNYEIAYIYRLPLSKNNEYTGWCRMAFLDDDIFNISYSGETQTWYGETIKNKLDNKNIGNQAYKDALNITSAKSKQDIINIIKKFSKKTGNHEKLDENLNVIY